MTISELIRDGFDLMLVGMGSVFAFLVITVAAVMLMSKLAAWLESLLPQAETRPTSPSGIPADHMAAISADLHTYRSSHRSK